MQRIPFLCEYPGCTTIERMIPSEYRAVRANSSHFFTVAGNETREEPLAKVVARPDGYVVVEKDVS